MEQMKRYTCGSGDGMYEDNNGHWIEYNCLKEIEKWVDEEIKTNYDPFILTSSGKACLELLKTFKSKLESLK